MEWGSLEDAHAAMVGYAERHAAEHDWTGAQLDGILADFEDAKASSDGFLWFDNDAGYLRLVGEILRNSGLPGADALAAVTDSALVTQQIEEQSDWEQGAGVFVDTVVESSQDVRGAGEMAGDAVKAGTSFLKTPAGKLSVAALAIGGLLLALRSR